MNMHRREFLRTIGATATTALLPSGGLAVQHRCVTKPNFVFILVDDLGWSDLSCFGADLHGTPNIDRLAREGMRFTDAYAASPVCTPTRASIMTGKYPARLHMTVWYEASRRPPHNRPLIPPITQADLPHEQVTIAEVLKEAGYQTAHVGKWHLGDAAHYPETQGFDVNIGGTFWGAPATFFYPYRGSRRFGGEFRYVPHLEFGNEDEYLTDRLTNEALKVIDKMHDAPFFLYLCYHAAHTPIEARKRLVEYYRSRILPGMNHQNATYAAMVHILDENVGRILARLEDHGIADRTLVFFFSDNGGYINKFGGQRVTSNYPLRSGKGSLYEGGIRVPLIVRWPGVTRPRSVCRDPVSSIDFYPTILEIAGLEGDPEHNVELDGKSIVRLLKNPGSSLGREALYWHYPHYYPTTTPVSAVRSGDWKLIHFFQDKHSELYNLGEDINERRDLAKLMPGKASQLKGLLEEWLQNVDAQLPEPNPAKK